jgi:DNA helicase-4
VNSWGSGKWGEKLTKSKNWTMTLRGDDILLKCEGAVHQAHISSAGAVAIKAGAIWSSVQFTSRSGAVQDLDGILNVFATDMAKTMGAARTRYLEEHHKRLELEAFDRLVNSVNAWSLTVMKSYSEHQANYRWLAEETVQKWAASRPSGLDGDFHLAKLVKLPHLATRLTTANKLVQYGVSFWQLDLRPWVKLSNDKHLASELVACHDLFNRIEKSPLTDEQARSVVCFDNRVLVVAAAGSGKTSTMVAKAAYALHRKLVPAERILLLAFNKDAAQELQNRVQERLTPLGFVSEGVVAQTFHKFGLDVIGHATGRKPSLASWLEGGKDITHLSMLIDRLKDSSPWFRTSWDLFRVVLSRDLPKFGKEQDDTEDWDRNTKQNGFRTLNDEIVKSHGERMVADWLFYNGVSYEYEPSYIHDTADATHKQYQPDFFYPSINLYHEHFALDQNGNPPAEFKGYMEGIVWKRGVHRRHNTSLIETTSAQLRTGEAFRILEKALTAKGVVLDPNPDRETKGRKPIENEDLVRLFRTFLTHAKSNDLSDKDLRESAKKAAIGTFSYRHDMFLDLFVDIRKAWEKSLRDSASIDFEDMLNIACDLLENGKFDSPYDLVMVDEFQDASKARARLTRGLVRKPGRFLFAVGDDWQSINRFAGADMSVMTKFEEWFGKGVTLKLERTFRCPQSICDVSSCFVLKNPLQIKKVVKSTQPEFAPALHCYQVADDGKIQGGLEKWMANLVAKIEAGTVAQSGTKKISVFVLGRYNRDSQYIPENWQTKFGRHLDVKFSSVHGSKGLEADYVILPRMAGGRSPFPSSHADDPVLLLAMPSDDGFAFSEERRLFYVALTRARRSVVLFTVDGNVSPFLAELVIDAKLELERMDGKKTITKVCPTCKEGTLVGRPNKEPRFLGCSRYPKCKHTENFAAKAELPDARITIELS